MRVHADYCEAQPPPGKARPDAPAILLVHGFGAFGDHWRANLQPLADQGFQVYAPTFPGCVVTVVAALLGCITLMIASKGVSHQPLRIRWR